MASHKTSCFICKNVIDKFPKKYCASCLQYICTECFHNDQNYFHDHMIFTETDPIICNPMIRCADCDEIIVMGKQMTFCYDCLEYICDKCQSKWPDEFHFLCNGIDDDENDNGMLDNWLDSE